MPSAASKRNPTPSPIPGCLSYGSTRPSTSPTPTLPRIGFRELALAADPPLQTIVIDFEGINLIDSQGSDAVGKIIDLAGYNDIEVRICRVKARVLEVLEADDVIERLGADRVYSNTYAAVADLIPPDNGAD